MEAPAAKDSVEQEEDLQDEEVGDGRLPACPLGGGGQTSEGLASSSHGVAAGSTPPPLRATTKGPLFLPEHLFLARLGHTTLSPLCWPPSRLSRHKGQCVPAEPAWPQKTLCTGSLRLTGVLGGCAVHSEAFRSGAMGVTRGQEGPEVASPSSCTL